jgi:hypothetical protein
MTPLARHAGPSLLARTGFAVLAAAGAFGLLVAPLRGRGAGSAVVETAASLTAVQRESVYAAIRDLDEDLETGKLSEADHARFEAELRARAAALLEKERRALSTEAQLEGDERSTRSAMERAGRAEPDRAPPEPGSEARPRCPSCGTPYPPDARFCSQCGSRLTAGEESTE